uniref:protein ARMCX6 n=1 Tax=Jaculus jaculus TaxID=51337 RepID=UPI00033334F9|nr:protein ARMCX6 [Jaculus jaculus]XP_044996390.1 protein ARMCX6 [Jaculus jaculus]XP_044996391.1 protein ARMCX6 [Jaculus jaculus]XP_044996392.1 protein ARMCX6 [Jaculus jaculus]
MGRAREVGWMAAGLMIGAGACYCVYRLTIGRDDDDKSDDEEEDEWDDDLDLDEEESEIWFDFTTMARPWSEDGDWNEPGAPGGTEHRPSGGGKANRAHPIKQRPFPYEHKNTWNSQSYKTFTCVLDLTKCPFIQGKMSFDEPQDAGFSLSHNINSHLASLSMAGNTIPTPRLAVREKVSCAPENLNASIKNQGQIKTYIDEVCQETVSRSCNSFLQQAGLNLLISMTVINNMLAKSVSDLKFPLITEGSERAKVQVLEPLMGLSENEVLVGNWLGTQMLFSSMSLFISIRNRESILEALVP